MQKRVNQLKYIKCILQVTASEEEQKDYISRVVKIAFDFHAKVEQVEAIWQLLIQKQDVILVTQISFEKSLIFQMLPLLIDDSLILNILLLNVIGKDQ